MAMSLTLCRREVKSLLPLKAHLTAQHRSRHAPPSQQPPPLLAPSARAPRATTTTALFLDDDGPQPSVVITPATTAIVVPLPPLRHRPRYSIPARHPTPHPLLREPVTATGPPHPQGAATARHSSPDEHKHTAALYHDRSDVVPWVPFLISQSIMR
ncbi:hypothetical protein CONLIGDRAFT_649818 [Coniochaeta ligniaria NRRL 30616]|uniref:Uncharacterized protein n=1 Tax=Coniochaeta ligniaria NRRL 30616 TaxID=1408157 RepID=A0A1J7J717_9PEZI|nr:hypothetical protein CONLIGDRAFT_649818 [Coniochaeta ligniaria NRRL 30616]